MSFYQKLLQKYGRNYFVVHFGLCISAGRVLSAERGSIGGKNLFLQPVFLKMKLFPLKIKPISLNLWHVPLMMRYFTTS